MLTMNGKCIFVVLMRRDDWRSSEGEVADKAAMIGGGGIRGGGALVTTSLLTVSGDISCTRKSITFQFIIQSPHQKWTTSHFSEYLSVLELMKKLAFKLVKCVGYSNALMFYHSIL